MEELYAVQRFIRFAKVLQMRIDGKTYEEIGKEMKITRERARQIERKAVFLAKEMYGIKTQ